jgi:hypothetical protein
LKLQRVLADEKGSMLPLFLVFVLIVLSLAGSAANLSAISLQKQRLQSQADQEVLSDYLKQGLGLGQTAEREKCFVFELPVKLIGLPATHEICVQSAAR